MRSVNVSSQGTLYLFNHIHYVYIVYILSTIIAKLTFVHTFVGTFSLSSTRC